MSAYNYTFERFGCLMRSRGIPIIDAEDNYLCGEPQFVWWWPINWVVITIYVILFLPIHLYRAYKDRKVTK